MENVAFLCSLILYMYRRQFRKVHCIWNRHFCISDSLTQSFDQSVSMMNNHQPRHIKHFRFFFKWESTCIFHYVLCFFSRSGTCMVFIFIITLIWEEFWQIMGSKVTHSGRTFHSRATMRSVDINAEICIKHWFDVLFLRIFLIQMQTYTQSFFDYFTVLIFTVSYGLSCFNCWYSSKITPLLSQ